MILSSLKEYINGYYEIYCVILPVCKEATAHDAVFACHGGDFVLDSNPFFQSV